MGYSFDSGVLICDLRFLGSCVPNICLGYLALVRPIGGFSCKRSSAGIFGSSGKEFQMALSDLLGSSGTEFQAALPGFRS